MIEKFPKPSEPKPETRNPFQKGLDFLRRKREEKKVKQEREETKAVAEWALMKFMSGEVQTEKRSIYPNKYEDTVKPVNLLQTEATIFRVYGGALHNTETIFWFVVVKSELAHHSFRLKTDGKTLETLEPRAEGYSLQETASYPEDKLVQPVPIQFFLNWLFGCAYDDELASSEIIDIMFAGSPEKAAKKEIGSLHTALQQNLVAD